MSKRKKRKIGAWIYAIFIAIWVSVLAVGAVYVLSKVWDYAEEYEAARPEIVINAYVENLRENLWGASIEETLSQMPHEMQSDADVAQIVQNMLRNEISYSRQSGTGDTATIVYNLRCGDRVFGQVTLKEDESKAKDVEYGQLPWMVYKEEFDFTGLYSSMQITVPATYSVQLNGNKLGSEYIIEDGIHYDVLEGYYENYPNLPTKVTYRFENIIGNLEPVVLDENGNETVIDETRDDSQFIHTVEEGPLLNRLTDFTNAFTERYRSYVSGAGNAEYGYQRLAAYMQLGSDLDERMKLAQDGLSWAHTFTVSMTWIELNSAIDIGDGYYILDISSETKTLQPGQGEVNNVQSMKVIVSDVGNELRAVAMDIYENRDL